MDENIDQMDSKVFRLISYYDLIFSVTFQKKKGKVQDSCMHFDLFQRVSYSKKQKDIFKKF